MQNLRYAMRMLRKTPVMTATILLTLGIGIGAVTASFTVGYVAILTPLPYPEAQQLMTVASKIKTFHNSVAAEDFLDWKEQNHSFQAMAAYNYTAFNISTGDQPESIPGMRTTPGYYSELGGPGIFFLGRDFLPEEGVAGKEHVVILSHSLWQRLGGNLKIIGSSMNIDGLPYTIVGVTTEGPLDRSSRMTVHSLKLLFHNRNLD